MKITQLIESSRKNIDILITQCLNPRDSKFYPYLVAATLIGLALLLRMGIAPVNAGLQYVTFFPAVTIAAIIGGYRAGLFATLLGLLLATYIFFPPYYSFIYESQKFSVWSNLVFLVDGLIISFSIEALRNYRNNQIAKEHELSERLALATQAGGIGVWDWDIRNNKLSWDNQMYKLYGYGAEQFGGGYGLWFSGVHPEDAEQADQEIKRALSGEKDFDTEFRVVWPNGAVRNIRALAKILRDRDGRPLRMIGTNWDITEQKQVENEFRIAAVTFNSHDAIMIVDACEHILRVNKAFERLTGYSAEEVIGQTPRMLSSSRHDEAFYSAMWQQLQNDGFWVGEIWDRRKSGEVYPKQLNITAIKNNDDEHTGYVAIFSDISARKEYETRIHNLAFYDALTKLPNRRLLLDRLQQVIASCNRSQQQAALLFIDLDNFKMLNDTKGHDLGDHLLQIVAERIQSCVRESDTVARIGGDEFVVILTGLKSIQDDVAGQAQQIGEKILDSLNLPYQLSGYEHYCSVSIGVTLFGKHGSNGDELMKQADIAMYQAKNSGRNALRFFDPEMQASIASQAELERDLLKAIDLKQLHLYYQIQYTHDYRPLGAEALIRWIHPERGMLSPLQFIPIAESSTLINDIGNWVIEVACSQLAIWGKSELTRDLILAINVSANQFIQPDFVSVVERIIKAHGILPNRLKLELTESVIVNDISAVISKMHALKSLGVRLSLDDFGTGYSSLSYLKRLPIDQLKIDKSFIRDVLLDPNDAIMVKTIIDMARNFNLNVIAEGVETKAQLEFLEKNGCLAYQGYYFSQPVPVEAFNDLLKRPPSFYLFN